MPPSAQNKKETANGNHCSSLVKENPKESNAIQMPQISLLKGGGVLKGIDDKFQVNPSNSKAPFRIPLPLSPNRMGFPLPFQSARSACSNFRCSFFMCLLF